MNMIRSANAAKRAWQAELRKHIKPGKAFFIDFEHDDDCLIYSEARSCTCNCDRVLMDDRRQVIVRVEGAGCFDPLETMGELLR